MGKSVLDYGRLWGITPESAFHQTGYLISGTYERKMNVIRQNALIYSEMLVS